jgi:Xaa-Pro aminopeptidase
MTRIGRLAERLEQPHLVTKAANVRYLTGMLDSSNAALLVEPSGEATIYTDFRYADAARALDGVAFVQTKRHVVTSLGELLGGRSVSVDPEQVTHAAWEQMRTGGVGLSVLSGAVEALRAVKDEGEIALIRQAASLSDTVFAEFAGLAIVGKTERDLAWWIDKRFRELGAEGSAFDTMVGAGEMGARPHGEPRDLPIPAGTMVVVDTGCVVDGYRSDCTRTFLTGDDERLLEMYRLCAQAQLDGLEAVHPGATARDVDAASRVAIEAAGLAERYGHGLGHGVGLEIHEGPGLRPESDDVLAEGNIITIEPGLYLDGDVGVRIEDLVLVTADGGERLTTFTKEPIVLS